jgi:MOSC domain-containing protein YiiM
MMGDKIMGMKLISVNLGKEQIILKAKKSGVSGIFKNPVSQPVQVTTLGLRADTICDKENHGGPDQAVYVYGAPDYAWWAQELGQEVAPGTFGENLTIEGLESAQYSIGDRLYVGPVILEVTAPRIPCSTLAARMGDPAFVKRFRHAERPGLYCRVIQEGPVQVGDGVRREPCPGPTVTVTEMYRDFYEPHLDEQTLRRYLAAPIAVRDRVLKEEKLQKLLAQNSGD